MSRTLANPTEMIRLGAPRVIHSEEDLAAYTEALFELTAKVNSRRKMKRQSNSLLYISQ